MSLIKSIVFIFSIIVLFSFYECGTSKSIVGIYSVKYENKFIQLLSNHKFKHKDQDVKDTIMGQWSWKNGKIILATKLQPNNFSMYKVSEAFVTTIHKDSIYIIYKPRQGYYFDPKYKDSVFTFPLRFTEVNGIPYSTPINGRLQIKKQGKLEKLKTHGSKTDYPIYYFKNSNSNYITVNIDLIPDEGEYFQYGSYFENEELIFKNGFLINPTSGDVYYKR